MILYFETNVLMKSFFTCVIRILFMFFIVKFWFCILHVYILHIWKFNVLCEKLQ